MINYETFYAFFSEIRFDSIPIDGELAKSEIYESSCASMDSQKFTEEPREVARRRNGSLTIKSLHQSSSFALWEFQTVTKRFLAITETTTQESSNVSAKKP
jgi:hypothetical protein